jgi:hypothetical protein
MTIWGFHIPIIMAKKEIIIFLKIYFCLVNIDGPN